MKWKERIDAAEERGKFSKEEQELALDHGTCAVGEQGSLIPRLFDWSPEDRILRFLGESFYAHVCFNEFIEARSTLVSIESRSKEILDNMSRLKEEGIK
jgi:hypothetical protein